MVTEKTLKTQAEYQKKHYKQVAIRWKIEFVDRLMAAAGASDEPSLAAYVQNALEARMEKEGFGRGDD